MMMVRKFIGLCVLATSLISGVGSATPLVVEPAVQEVLNGASHDWANGWHLDGAPILDEQIFTDL